MNKLKPILSARKDCTISYTIVILAFILIQTMIATGNITSSLKGQLVPICAYIVMAISLNLTVGILGELSLGHAGFMSVGAFTGIVVSTSLAAAIPNGPLRLAISMIVGGLFAGIAGLIVGIPVLRLKGDYLAIVTLAFGEIIKNIINVLYIGLDEKGLHFSLLEQHFTLAEGGSMIINGPMGVGGVQKLSTFSSGVVLILITLFLVLNLIHSRTGRAIMAIRDNRIAAESIGINITKYKLMAFTISASLAGVAGVLYAHNLATLAATPKSFGYNMSIMILVFVVLGGIGNIRGSMIAAVILTLLPEMLRSLNNYRMLIYAVVLIVMMLLTSSPKAIEVRGRIFSSFRKKKTEGEA